MAWDALPLTTKPRENAERICLTVKKSLYRLKAALDIPVGKLDVIVADGLAGDLCGDKK